MNPFTQALSSGLAVGQLQKLQIFYETTAPNTFSVRPIEVLFNPNSLTRSEKVSWQDKKLAGSGMFADDDQLMFSAKEPETLTVTLFFDTSEGKPTGKTLGQTLTGLVKDPFAMAIAASPSGVSVKDYTDQIAALAGISQELHRPPVCQLIWGTFFIFQGVLTQLEQTFNHFLADGTPLAASLTCTFTEYSAPTVELHSADVAKQWVVQRGDTLSGIAGQVYNDPTQWRPIALANQLTDPRNLRPGQTLTIPPLT